MILLLNVIIHVLWAAMVADDTPTLSSFLIKLDNTRLLRVARLCQAAYHLPKQLTAAELTQRWRESQVISPTDKVILQGYRHGDQLAAAVIKGGGTQPNHFTIVFAGSESAQDWASDGLLVAVPEDARSRLHALLHALLPTQLHTKHSEDTVDVHLGFKRANKAFLKQLFAGITPHVRNDHPITFELYGHSMGGALAMHAAYRLCKALPKHLNILPEQVTVDVVTFAAAGAFQKDDMDVVGRVMRADNSAVHFVRQHDFARAITDRLGFSNPGHVILLDDYVRVEGGLDVFLERVRAPSDIWARAGKEAANHGIGNYISTIEAGISLTGKII